MHSWELLKDAVERVGAKSVAAKLSVSCALVYKWCQEPPSDKEPQASGARNPLDRVKEIAQVTGDDRIINWLCNAAGGFFVLSPRVEPGNEEEQLLGTTQRVVQDFGELLTSISTSIENDGKITAEEAERIRQSWEHMKGQVECFALACERGMYGGRASGG